MPLQLIQVTMILMHKTYINQGIFYSLPLYNDILHM